MPKLSCWFIKASLAYLTVGFTFGALILANKGIAFFPTAWNLLPAHMEFLLAGWTIQLAMGVSFWILPRFSQGLPRGNESLTWLAFILINTGIWLAAGGSLSGMGWPVVFGRLLEAAAALAFAIGSWRRVRPFQT